MATIKLNIYKAEDKNIIEKTYKVEGYDLMLGTVDDVLEVIDIDKLNDKAEVAKMVVKGYKTIKPILMDIFPGVTDEELKRVKIKELILVMMDVATATAEILENIQSKN